MRSARDIRDDEGFLIQHFAGSVVYTTVNSFSFTLIRSIVWFLFCQAQFLDKNNDALHTSLLNLVQECKNTFIKSLFAKAIESAPTAGKLNFISIGSKFRSQLAELLTKLRSTVSIFFCSIDEDRDEKKIVVFNRVLVSFDVLNRT